MRTIRLVVAYDGTPYFGWQRQAAFDSVQERLEAAVEKLTGDPASVVGAGRTDTGVHALRQVAHFHTPSALPDERFLLGLNAWLPPSITVHEARTVAPPFHARFDATGKRYVYRLLNVPLRPALARDLACWVPVPLDVSRMRAAARFLVGEHDFASFAVAGGAARRTTVRRIDHIHLSARRGRIDCHFQGSGFLHNQVRAMVGSLIEVGRGKREPVWIRHVLEARDRKVAGPTAPAHGLYLLRVLYASRPGAQPPADECHDDGGD